MLTITFLAQLISADPAYAQPVEMPQQAPMQPAGQQMQAQPQLQIDAQAMPPPGEAAPPVPQGAYGEPLEPQTPPSMQAGQYTYYGYHPVQDGHGTFCVSPGIHLHPFPPFDSYQFTWWNGAWVFVGDPSDFGYPGPAYPYWATHPLPWGGWCFFPGGHYHLFAGWGPYFSVSGSFFVYIGGYPRWYYRLAPRYTNYYRTVYPKHYHHPYVAPSQGGRNRVHQAPAAPGRSSNRGRVHQAPPASSRRRR
jgi:hypothetical protein